MAVYANGAPWRDQFGRNASANSSLAWASGTSFPSVFPTLNVGRCGAVVTVNRVFIWSIGYVSTALIGSDGVVGSFTSAALAAYHPVSKNIIRVGPFIYFLGGFLAGNSTFQPGIYRHAVNADGTLGALEFVNITLSSIEIQCCFVVGWFLYYRTAVNTYRASILPDGSISDFVNIESTSPYSYYHPAPVVCGNTVHLIAAGRNTENAYDFLGRVVSATFSADGSKTPWVEGALIPTRAIDCATVCTTSSVLCIGGQDFSYPLNQNAEAIAVRRASVNASGALVTWAEDSAALPGPKINSTAFVTSSRLYVVGGENIVYGNESAAVYYAPFTGGTNEYYGVTASTIALTSSVATVVSTSDLSYSVLTTDIELESELLIGTSTPQLFFVVVTQYTELSSVSCGSYTSSAQATVSRALSSVFTQTASISSLQSSFSILISSLVVEDSVCPALQKTVYRDLSSVVLLGSSTSSVQAVSAKVLSSLINIATQVADTYKSINLGLQSACLTSSSASGTQSNLATYLSTHVLVVTNTAQATSPSTFIGASTVSQASSTSELKVPGVLTLASIIQPTTETLTAFNALGRPIQSTLFGHANVSALEHLISTQLVSSLILASNTSIILVASALSNHTSFILKKTPKALLVQKPQVIKLKVQTQATSIKTLHKYSIKKVTYGIII